jgi:hypothetical protein
MKASSLTLFPIVIIIYFGVKITNAQNTSHKTKQAKIEDLILSKINKLPEVKQYLRKNEAEKAALLLARSPDSSFKYFWIELGVSNFDVFRTADNFYVASDTFRVFYLDMMDDSDDPANGLLTLKQWRRWRSDPRFWKMHVFKGGKITLVN